MKHRAFAVLAFVSLATAGCGKKDSDPPSPGDKPATTAPATATTPSAAAPAGKKASAADLPPECKEFTDAFEKLMKCDALKAGAAEMKEGYEKMLKAMADLGDPKASAEGCKMGIDSLKEALKTAGC